jgi:hypothetical protein
MRILPKEGKPRFRYGFLPTAFHQGPPSRRRYHGSRKPSLRIWIEGFCGTVGSEHQPTRTCKREDLHHGAGHRLIAQYFIVTYSAQVSKTTCTTAGQLESLLRAIAQSWIHSCRRNKTIPGAGYTKDAYNFGRSPDT